MARQKFMFESLQNYIKENDNVSLEYILKWEYQKDKLFELKNDEGLTLVHQACLESRMKCLDILLRNGASPHVRSSVGWTPLHAATLGGNPKIVSYLLDKCSVDPCAKDEMNCMASDLTMDERIVNLLKEATQNSKIKKHLELISSQTPAMPRKLRSMTQLAQQSKIPRGKRTQSMFVSDNEAAEIRSHFNPQVGLTITQQLNQYKNEFPNNNDEQKGGTLTHSKTQSLRRKPIFKRSCSSKELHNNAVLREKTNQSELIKSGFATLPRAVKFITSRSKNSTGSKSRSNSESSSRHRDSGIFDDDTETELCDSFTKNSSLKEIEGGHHYNLL